MQTFFKNLKFIFMPHYWVMNEEYSPAWDAELNKLLDSHKFTDIGQFTAKLDLINIWIVNYPYACFTNEDRGKGYRASRQTIYRANKLLILSGGRPKYDPYV